MSVLLYHVTFSFGYPKGILAYVSQRVSGPPFSAVVVFFLISGFVLYRPYARARYRGQPAPSLLPYAVRRVARIVPGYWVALLIVSFMLSEHVLHTPLGALRYFGFAQLYGNWNTTVNGGISPAWTLCVEVTFYAALPLLALAVRRFGQDHPFLRSELTFCGGLVLLALAWQIGVLLRVPVGNPWLVSILNFLPGTLDLFAFGMALAALSVAAENRRTPPAWLRPAQTAPLLWWLAGLAAFFGVGRLGSLGAHQFTSWWLITHELKAIGSALLLIPLVFGKNEGGPFARILGSRPLLYLGTISYGIYLWHFPLLHALSPHLVHHGELFTFLALSAVTIAVASLSYFLVELPARRLASQYLRQRVRPAPSSQVGTAAGVTSGV
jgi:peptidoglycan/LPS O-acetylase OafA/YrhL